jgi:hypothetical protein
MCFLGICCGCGNKTVTKLDVTNQINSAITNSTKTINDIVNKTITDITTNLINTVSANIHIDTGSSNSFTATDLYSDGSTINIDQQAKTDAQAIATMQIASDANSLSELTNSIIENLKNKATNNSDLTTAMNTMNQIKTITDNAGGPEQMVDKVFKSLQDTISGGGDSNDQEKTFKNLIGITVNNETLNQNTIEDIISTSIKGKITNNTFGDININNAASNSTLVHNVTAIMKDGKSASINIIQNADLKSFQKTIIDLNLGSSLANKILTNTDTSSLTDALNKTAEKVKDDSTTVVVDKTKQGSAIMSFLDNLNPLNLLKSFGQYGTIILIVIIVLVCAFIFFIFILPHMSKKSPAPIGISNSLKTVQTIPTQ